MQQLKQPTCDLTNDKQLVQFTTWNKLKQLGIKTINETAGVDEC